MATISIGLQFQQIGNGLTDVIMDYDKFKKVMHDNLSVAEKLQKKFTDIGSVNLGLDAVKEMATVMTDLSNAFAIQVEAETKLETVMRQRMNSTDEEIQSIKEFCSAQQEIGIIGDEVQLAGAQQIATFLNEKEALQSLIPAMNNLVAQQKGLNATSEDCRGIANLLGKAMQGQVSALREVGITFTEAEGKAVQFGTEQERAAALAKIITSNVGEMNAALAKTDAGKAKQMENTMGDLKEQIGSVVAGMMPMIERFNFFVTAGANAGKVVNVLRAIPTTFAAIKSAVSVGITAIQGMIAKMKALAISANIAGTAMRTALMATGIGVAIAALGFLVSELATKFSDTGDAAKEMSEEMQRAADAEKAIRDNLSAATGEYHKHLAETQTFVGTKEEEIKKVKELNQLYGESMGHYQTMAEWQKVLTQNLDAYIQKLTIEAEAEALKNRLTGYYQTIEDIEKEPMNPLFKGNEAAWEADKKKRKEQINGLYRYALDKLAGLQKKANELSEKMRSNIPSDKNKGTTAPSIKPEDKPAPEGTFKWYEDEIKKLQEKFNVADAENRVKLKRQIDEYTSILSDLKFEVEVELRLKQKGEEFFSEVTKKMDKTTSLKLTIDEDEFAKGLPETIAPLASTAGDALSKAALQELLATEKQKEYNQTLQDSANLVGNLGTAMSNLGQMTDDPKAKVAGIVATTIANIMGSFASALASTAPLGPIGWTAFGISGLAQAMAMVSQIKSVTAFANGGIVSGPTMALVGEYAGASNNPEVIAPLNKLRSLLPDPQSSVQHVVVTGRIKGSDIELVTGNRRRIVSASGRKY